VTLTDKVDFTSEQDDWSNRLVYRSGA